MCIWGFSLKCTHFSEIILDNLQTASKFPKMMPYFSWNQAFLCISNEYLHFTTKTQISFLFSPLSSNKVFPIQGYVLQNLPAFINNHMVPTSTRKLGKWESIFHSGKSLRIFLWIYLKSLGILSKILEKEF